MHRTTVFSQISFALSFLSLIFFSTTPLGAEQSLKIDRLEKGEFRKKLLADSALMNGLVGKLEVAGQSYLISVGICSISKEAQGEKLLRAIKYARIMAKEKITRLIPATWTMSSKESFTSTYEKITKVDSAGNEDIIKRVKKVLSSVTKEQGEAFIHNPMQKELGWWITSEGDLVRLAIAYPIPETPN